MIFGLPWSGLSSLQLFAGQTAAAAPNEEACDVFLHGSAKAAREYKQITENPPEGLTAGPIDEENLFEWECLVLGPDSTPYEGGCFHALLSFPKDYPMNPPKMRFTTPIWHPNIHSDGKVCISILHAPGEDATGYERSEERWSPVQSVEKVLISVISMMAEPNDESPSERRCCKNVAG